MGFISDAVSKGEDEAERLMLKAYFLPDNWITWYQNERESFGIGPPSATILGLEQFLIIPIIFAMILMLIKWLFMYIFTFYSNGVTGKLHDHKEKLLFIITFTMIICFAAFYIYVNFIEAYLIRPKSVNTVTDAVIAISSAGTVSGFQNPSSSLKTDDAQYKLVNIQPLAVKQAGFLGPAEINGEFNPEVTIMNGIRLGVRFFTLQIDYLDSPKDAKLFDNVGTPTLLYRNVAGKLISTNGATIKNVAQQLATYAFSPDFGSQVQPIVVYLHFVRTPDAIRKPKEYLKYMMQVAEALQPIQSFILKDTSLASFRRQQNEAGLLEIDLTSIEKSIILLSNADTTLFRNTKAVGMTVGPISDLDSLINMRVYLDSESDSKLFGITEPVHEKKPYAIIVPYSRIKGLSQKERDAFAIKNKRRFVIAMPDQMESPTQADMKLVLNEAGVNVIPINLIGTDPKQITSMVSLWQSDSYYKLKPMMLQSFKMGVNPSTA